MRYPVEVPPVAVHCPLRRLLDLTRECHRQDATCRRMPSGALRRIRSPLCRPPPFGGGYALPFGACCFHHPTGVHRRRAGTLSGLLTCVQAHKGRPLDKSWRMVRPDVAQTGRRSSRFDDLRQSGTAFVGNRGPWLARRLWRQK